MRPPPPLGALPLVASGFSLPVRGRQTGVNKHRISKGPRTHASYTWLPKMPIYTKPFKSRVYQSNQIQANAPSGNGLRNVKAIQATESAMAALIGDGTVAAWHERLQRSQGT